MKLVFKLIAVVLFVIFFGLALKNTQEVTLYFFWNYEMRGPLVLLLLGFFAAGSILGVLAMVPMTFRNRRELSKHRKMIANMEESNEVPKQIQTLPPSVDTITKNQTL